MNELHLVIADDDACLLRLLERRLTKAGYAVSTCENGLAARDLVAEHEPVVLLADWEMPGLNGVELCQELQEAKCRGGIYIILMTANGEPEQIVVGLEAGADDYLVKPTHPAELLARIQNGARSLQHLSEIREQKELLGHILSNTPQGIFWKNRDSVYQGCNAVFARDAGVKTAEEVIGKTDFNLAWKPNEAEFYRECDGKVMETGHPMLNIEESQHQADGTEAWLLTSKVPLRDSQGEVTGVLGTYVDITQRKMAEESQRRLTRAVEAAAEAIVLTNADAKIVQINPAFSKITGYSATDILGKTPGLLKSGRQPQEFYERMWKTIESGSVWADRLINKRKDGSHYNAELNIAPIVDSGGAVTGYVGVHRDVTEQVEREQELQAAMAETEEALAKLQQVHAQLLQADKMASIGNLAAGVAHEINNPIGFITSNLNSLNEYVTDLERVLSAYDDLLRETTSGGASVSEKADDVTRIREEADLDYVMSDLGNLIEESTDGAKRVRQIVADLRDFSHVDSPNVAEEDVNQLIEKTISVAWNELKYKTEVVREFNDLPTIPCYGGKLGQVFLNLLVNAAQAIEERGIITVRTGCLDEHIWIEISDTGRGISKENVDRIFDPFFTTKEVGKGTGLGLHLTRTIVKAHGGRIAVQSQEGEGTTFRVELPLTGPSEAEEDEAESEPSVS